MKLSNWKIGSFVDDIDHELPIKMNFLEIIAHRPSSRTLAHRSGRLTIGHILFSSPISNSKLCEIGNENQIRHAKHSQMLSIWTAGRRRQPLQLRKNRSGEEKKKQKPQNNWLTLTSLYDFSFVWNVLTLDSNTKTCPHTVKMNKK